MAYIARLRSVGAASSTLSAAPLIQTRGDKWYIDPEDMRQYDAPFHVRWGGGFPKSYGPNWENDVFMNKNSMYPRMPYYHRSLKNVNIKYETGLGSRRNFGETMHIMEPWLAPQNSEWSRDNGTENIPGGIVDIFLVAAFFVFGMHVVDYMDKQYALSMFAPKVLPYDNLWVEQGGNPLVPSEKRPYINAHIIDTAPDMGGVQKY